MYWKCLSRWWYKSSLTSVALIRKPTSNYPQTKAIVQLSTDKRPRTWWNGLKHSHGPQQSRKTMLEGKEKWLWLHHPSFRRHNVAPRGTSFGLRFLQREKPKDEHPEQYFQICSKFPQVLPLGYYWGKLEEAWQQGIM